MANIQVIRTNSLGINRGIYADWMGNALSSGQESTLLSEGAAVVVGTVPGKTGPIRLDITRGSQASDNFAEPLFNDSASAFNYTVDVGHILQDIVVEQRGTGAVTVLSGTNVQFIGTGNTVITSLATTGRGSMVLVRPLDLQSTPRVYTVIKGGA